MVLEKKLEVFLGELVVVASFLIKILDGLILSTFLLQMVNGQKLNIVFLFWKVLKDEVFFQNINVTTN